MVYDKHLLPGLAYIDLLYQTSPERGHAYRELASQCVPVPAARVGPDEDLMLHIRARPSAGGGPGAGSPATVSSIGSIANGVSHYFNFQGPPIAVDTMSSSAMTAVHLACAGLMRGECQVAVAGGVSLLRRGLYVTFSRLEALGRQIDRRSFGDGNGFVLAECVGAVLLKPLDRAAADRDRVLAVITSTTARHAGRAHDILVPNPAAQAELVQANLLKSGLEDVEAITYVEAAANGSYVNVIVGEAEPGEPSRP